MSNVEYVRGIVGDVEEWIDVYYTRYMDRMGFAEGDGLDKTIDDVTERADMDVRLGSEDFYVMIRKKGNTKDKKVYDRSGLEKVFFTFKDKEVVSMEERYKKDIVNNEGELNIPFVVTEKYIVVNENFDLSKWEEEDILRCLIMIEFKYKYGMGVSYSLFKNKRFLTEMVIIFVGHGFYDESDDVQLVKPKFAKSKKSKELKRLEEELKKFDLSMREINGVSWEEVRNVMVYCSIKEGDISGEDESSEELRDESSGIDYMEFKYKEKNWNLTTKFAGRVQMYEEEKTFKLYGKDRGDGSYLLDHKLKHIGKVDKINTIQMLDSLFD